MQTIWHTFWLIYQFSLRDIRSKYIGSRLGWLWSILTPMLMLGVYTFAFKYIFQVRWPGASDDVFFFALNLFAGLLLHQALVECLGRAPRLIIDQPHLVKKVVFPLSVLPWAVVSAALFHALVSIAVLTLLAISLGYIPGAGLLALPLALLGFAALLAAATLFLATLGVFLRDLPQWVQFFVALLQFLSPVFYPMSAAPPWVQSIMGWNPMVAYMETLRAVLFGSPYHAAGMWVKSLLVTVLLTLLAHAFHRKVRHGFADVL